MVVTESGSFIQHVLPSVELNECVITVNGTAFNLSLSAVKSKAADEVFELSNSNSDNFSPFFSFLRVTLMF